MATFKRPKPCWNITPVLQGIPLLVFATPLCTTLPLMATMRYFIQCTPSPCIMFCNSFQNIKCVCVNVDSVSLDRIRSWYQSQKLSRSGNPCFILMSLKFYSQYLHVTSHGKFLLLWIIERAISFTYFSHSITLTDCIDASLSTWSLGGGSDLDYF